MSPYQTHQPLLFACAALAIASGGEIVELGCGLHSSPQLEAMCMITGVPFRSYETDSHWAATLAGLIKGLRHVENYDDVPLTPCGMVFIDNAPEARRATDVRRFLDVARLVVVHDSDPAYASLYGLDAALSLYPHRFDYTPMSPNTTVVSRDGEAIRQIREVFNR